MMPMNKKAAYEDRQQRHVTKRWWHRLHIDPLLFFLVLALCVVGLVVLYSASNASYAMILRQGSKMLLAIGLMLLFAQLPPNRLKQWAPWLFALALLLLAMVLFIGQVDQGARRWIVAGPLRFQPSECMKLALPLMLAWYFHTRPKPAQLKHFACGACLLLLPVLLTAKQPDLGTAILIAMGGITVLVLAGMPWKLMVSLAGCALLSVPLLWHFMHAYQRERILTLLNPERDPLGSGYHIIQSKIAIGAGGFWGQGWLHGTQSHLSFLPAHTTDFIFAVGAEEFGFMGASLIIVLLFLIFLRMVIISLNAQTTFTRLLTGSLSMSFIAAAYTNLGMVVGILPVVGVPLTFVSYGGSAMLISMIAFGMMMSVFTNRTLYSSE